MEREARPPVPGHPAERLRGLVEPLTLRETEVLQALAQGLPRPAIARGLGVSTNTIKYHLRNIYAKLGVCSSAQALRIHFGMEGRNAA